MKPKAVWSVIVFKMFGLSIWRG